MLGGGAVHRKLRQVEVLQDAQRDQCGNALPVRRNLVQFMAGIGLRDRRHPLGPVGSEIRRGDRPTRVLGEGFDGRGDLAAIEGLALAGGDQLEAARRIRELEQLAHLRRPAARHEGLGVTRLRVELRQRRGQRPFALRDHRHRVAALGNLDRRRHQVGERQLAELAAQGHPRGHRAGHRHRAPAALRRCLRLGVEVLAEVVRRPGLRRRAGGVQAVQRPAVPQDAEGIGAQAVAAGLDQRHAGRRRNGRIDRVAACGHHAQSRLGSQRMRGRHDVAREQRAARAGIAGSPVEGFVRHRRQLHEFGRWPIVSEPCARCSHA